MVSGSKIPGGQGFVKLNEPGMRELLLSPEIERMLANRMARVQSALPGSRLYTTRGPRGGARARAVVARGSDFDEANTGELSRALDLAGGLRGRRKQARKPRARKVSD